MTYARDRRRKLNRRLVAVEFIDPNDPAMRRVVCTCRSVEEFTENHNLISKKRLAAPNPLLSPDRSRPWPDPAVT